MDDSRMIRSMMGLTHHPSLEDMDAILNQIESESKDDNEKKLGIFRNNRIFESIFIFFDSRMEKTEQIDILEDFFQAENLTDCTSKEIASSITKLFSSRFMKIENASTTSQASRAAINHMSKDDNNKERFDELQKTIHKFFRDQPKPAMKSKHSNMTINQFSKLFARNVAEMKEAHEKNEKEKKEKEKEKEKDDKKAMEAKIVKMSRVKVKEMENDKKIAKLIAENEELFIFLKVMFLLSGIWWKIDRTIRVINNPFSDQMRKFVTKLNDYASRNLLDLSFTNFQGHTLYHTLAAFDFAKAFEILMTLDNDVAKYKDLNGKSAIDWAIDYGKWNIFFSTMGSKTRQKVNNERNKVEKQRGVIGQFLTNQCNKKLGSMALNSIVDTMISMIKEKKPISDDLLLLCWKFELSKKKKSEKYDPLSSPLWKAIEETVQDVLTIPINKVDWFWFKEYLFYSSIWHEDSISIEMRNKLAEMKKKQGSSENDEDEELKVPCICGAMMEKVLPSVVYGGGAGCDDCACEIDQNNTMYHCPTGSNKTHEYGHDYCMDCARKHHEKSKKSKGGSSSTASAVKGLGATVGQMIKSGSKDTSKSKNDELESKEESINQVINSNESTILYGKLVKICDNKLGTPKKFLKEKIESLMKSKTEKDAWMELVNYPQYVACDPNVGLRQDGVIDKVSGKEMLSFPNKSTANEKQLRDLGLLNIFDSQVYLTQLMVVAKSLNGKFHTDMKSIFRIKSKTHSSPFYGITDYRDGKIKSFSRCVAKAEIDYRSQKFPTTSCILDIIRCSVSCESSEKLVQCLKILENTIRSANESENEKNKSLKHLGLCLKRILRVKNRFAINKRQFEAKGGNSDKDTSWMYQYGDVKCNVLIEYQGKSMIVEIQFLLDFMVKAKSMTHTLYEITRNEPFMNDMHGILDTASNMQDQMYLCVNTNNMNRLGQILLCYPNDIDVVGYDKKGLTILHYACANGYTKLIKLILTYYYGQCTKNEEMDKFDAFINMRCHSTQKLTPLMYCCVYERFDAMKLLLSYKECDVTLANTSLDVPIESPLKWAVEQNQIAMIIEMLTHPNAGKYSDVLALIYCCQFGRLEIFETLMTQRVKYITKDGVNRAVRVAIANDQNQMVQQLMEMDGIQLNPDPKKGAFHESLLVSAIRSNNVAMIKTVDECSKNKLDWNIIDKDRNLSDGDKSSKNEVHDIWREVMIYHHKQSRFFKQFYQYAVDNAKIKKEDFDKRIAAHYGGKSGYDGGMAGFTKILKEAS